VTSRIAPKLLLVLVLALVAAACTRGGADETTTTTDRPETSTTSTTTTTTSSSTTTTTTTTLPPIGDTINGLPAEEELTQRRAVTVKIDNHPDAHPHWGLDKADAVYELLVEGGLTRLIAVYHQSDAEVVGPVRSGRPTDAGLVKPLGAPFQISGAQPWVKQIFRDEGVYMVDDLGITTYRTDQRRRPHNLLSSTPLIRDYADGRGWPDDPPPPLFEYGNDPTPLTDTATRIELAFSDRPPSVFEWDGERYLHFYGDDEHEWYDDKTDTRGQVTVDAIVVIEARKYTATAPGGNGTPVPAMDTVGSGDALVFRDGGVLSATWERGSIDEMIRIFDADGAEVVLPPGRPWIAIFPTNRTVVWD